MKKSEFIKPAARGRGRGGEALMMDSYDISTNADADLAARRLFNRIFEVEYRPDGSFLLKSKRTGEVVAGGWTGKRSAELPLEVAEP